MSIGGPSRLVPRTTQPSDIRITRTSSRPTGCERKNTRYCVPFSVVGSGGGVCARAFAAGIKSESTVNAYVAKSIRT